MNKTAPTSMTIYGALAVFIMISMEILGPVGSEGRCAVGQERESTSGWSRFAPKNWIQRESKQELTESASATRSADGQPLNTNQPRPLTVIDRRTAQRNRLNPTENRVNEPLSQSSFSNNPANRGLNTGVNVVPFSNPNIRSVGIDNSRNSQELELNPIEQAGYQQPPQARVYRTPRTPVTDFPYDSGAEYQNSAELPRLEQSMSPRIHDYQQGIEPPFVEERWHPGDQHPIQRPMPHLVPQDHPNRWENAANVTSNPRSQSASPPNFSREPFIDQPTVFPAGEHPVFNQNYRSGNYYPETEQGRGYLQTGSSFQGSELRQKPQTATEIAFQLQADNQRLQEILNRLQTENQDLRNQLGQQREQFERKEQEFQTSLNRIEQLQQRLDRRDAELALAIKEKNDIEFRTNEQLKSIEQMLDSVLLNQLTDRQPQD